MGLAASPSQALRGGSWAALLSIHFLKPLPDPARPESDLSSFSPSRAPKGRRHVASLAPTPLQPVPKGPRETGREGLGPTLSRAQQA